MEQQWNDIGGGRLEDLEKNLSYATLSTTNSTWTALGVNLGLCSEKLATNFLCYDKAQKRSLRKPEITLFNKSAEGNIWI
jgi:hypothetical protein